MFYVEFPSKEIFLKLKLIYGVDTHIVDSVCRLPVDHSIKLTLINNTDNSKNEVTTEYIWEEMNEVVAKCIPRVINIRGRRIGNKDYIDIYRLNCFYSDLRGFLSKDYLYSDVSKSLKENKLCENGLDSYIIIVQDREIQLFYNGCIVDEYLLKNYQFYPLVLSEDGKTLILMCHSVIGQFLILFYDGKTVSTKHISLNIRSTTDIACLDEFKDIYKSFLEYCN